MLPIDSTWHEAHVRATAWVRLGMVDQILNDDEIPEDLRERIWRFVQVLDAEPAESLPLEASENWFDELDDGSNWMRYISGLVAKKFPDKAIQSIEESTRRIMNFLYNPNQEEGGLRRYGLVVGRVQSGKTANYAGLIARAVDAGFQIIVVLAGLHNNLRRQTQIRLEDEIAFHDPANPMKKKLIPLTDKDLDFQTLPNVQLFSMGEDSAVLLVIKKNVAPLDKLYAQLSELSPLELMNLNMLIIDDEADHATINTKKIDDGICENPDLEGYLDDDDDELEEDDNEIVNATKINSRIRQILGLFTRYAYVGYTATPFANVLIDPNLDHPNLGPTLYPRDFILTLPKPDGYGGLDDFFPAANEVTDTDVSDQVIVVPRAEALDLRELDSDYEVGKESSLPNSLNVAVMDFFLSGAARLHRNGAGSHHTMLVHIKHTKRNQSPIHGRLSQLIEIWREQIPNSYSVEGQNIRDLMKKRWVKEFQSNPCTVEDWSIIEPALIRFTLMGVNVKLINSETGDTLDYSSHEGGGLRVIAVGGNRLSRGLTLEGLCTTYFIRESRMYDTLTQMGRWFGFRAGYNDLIRLHTTGLLVEWFTWLTSVERALISDIERYGKTGLTPTSLAVRILKHRAMLPTAKNKMRHARLISNGLSASTPRMTRFLFHDQVALKRNLNNLAEFLSQMNSDFEKPKANDNTLLWRQVDPNLVLSLIQGHKHHPEDRTFNIQHVEQYIKTRLDIDELSNWSVALISSQDGRIKKPLVDFGIDFDVGLPMRTRIKGGDSIGELIQASNVVIDLPGKTKDYMKNGHVSYPIMYEHRDPSNPLLLIYIIDRDSQPRDLNHNSRTTLFHDNQDRIEVVGYAMALPVSENEIVEGEGVLSEFWALEGVDHDG